MSPRPRKKPAANRRMSPRPRKKPAANRGMSPRPQKKPAANRRACKRPAALVEGRMNQDKHGASSPSSPTSSDSSCSLTRLRTPSENSFDSSVFRRKYPQGPPPPEPRPDGFTTPSDNSYDSSVIMRNQPPRGPPPPEPMRQRRKRTELPKLSFDEVVRFAAGAVPGETTSCKKEKGAKRPAACRN